MADVYKLLNENYVEDDDNMFRFHFFYCNPKDTKWKKCVMRTTSRTMTICLGSHRLTKKNVMNHVFLAFVQVCWPLYRCDYSIGLLRWVLNPLDYKNKEIKNIYFVQVLLFDRVPLMGP